MRTGVRQWAARYQLAYNRKREQRHGARKGNDEKKRVQNADHHQEKRSPRRIEEEKKPGSCEKIAQDIEVAQRAGFGIARGKVG
jgi:hypothetical protein